MFTAKEALLAHLRKKIYPSLGTEFTIPDINSQIASFMIENPELFTNEPGGRLRKPHINLYVELIRLGAEQITQHRWIKP